MIYPKHSWLYKWFFDFYTSLIIKSDFSKFIVESSVDKPGNESVLVIANHFSWWDGFFHYHLNNLVFKKKYHVMMLEEQLKKRMFLTKLGIFSVKKGSKDALVSLKFAETLLQNGENMVLIFPQGKIESQHTHTFTFESGIEWLIQRNKDVSVVFVISLVDYFSERKPEVRFYIEKATDTDKGNLEQKFNSFFEQCLRKQKASVN